MDKVRDARLWSGRPRLLERNRDACSCRSYLAQRQWPSSAAFGPDLCWPSEGRRERLHLQTRWPGMVRTDWSWGTLVFLFGLALLLIAATSLYLLLRLLQVLWSEAPITACSGKRRELRGHWREPSCGPHFAHTPRSCASSYAQDGSAAIKTKVGGRDARSCPASVFPLASKGVANRDPLFPVCADFWAFGARQRSVSGNQKPP